MSKFKFLVSFAFVLCLVLAMGTCAFAVDITTDTAEIEAGESIESIYYGVTVGTNYGSVGTNNGTVNHNFGAVTTNNKTITTNDGDITTNNGIVVYNNGTIDYVSDTGEVQSSVGLVKNNHGTVIHQADSSHPPVVVENHGTVKPHSSASPDYTGVVVYNFGGSVTDIEVKYNYYSITSNLPDLVLDVTYDNSLTPDKVEAQGGPYSRKILVGHTSPYYILEKADFSFEIPAGYTLKINGESATADNSGKAIVKNVDKNIHLEFTPVPKPVSSVPNTADNSNMPLWGALFISFAALAMLTRKKKA